MNPLAHCYALAVLLDDPSKGDDARNAVMPTSFEGVHPAGRCLAWVLARKEALNRECDAKALQSALRHVLACTMPMELAELLVPDNEPWTIQKELEMFRRFSRSRCGGLQSIFDVYLHALSAPMKPQQAPTEVPPTGSKSGVEVSKRPAGNKKRRGQPPRRARA